MRSSSTALLLAGLLALLGCAATVRRGEAPPAGSRAAPAPGEPAEAPPGGPPTGVSPDRPERPGPAGRLDSSEQITPEELASIPDPVPLPPSSPGAPAKAPSAANGGVEGSSPRSGDSVAPEGWEAPSGGAGAPSATGAATWRWRVQVFASESAEEAERVAREAGAKLGAPAEVVREGSLYKVRLGRFASEGEAQSLREKAIDAGYGGAFRTKTP